MKRNLILAVMLCFAGGLFAQEEMEQMTIEDWNYESKSDLRLLPKYGYKEKTAEQKQYDKEFITGVMQNNKFKGDKLAASNDLIRVGFDYMYKGDLKRAMYRFNQGWLLDSTNSEVFLGFGAIYLALRDFDNAQRMYREGLALNPDNGHLLTDYGTYYLGRFYDQKMQKEKDDVTLLDSAAQYLNRAYELNPKDQNATFKLSIVYFHKGDCANAWKYYDICKSLGGQPITEDYTNDLKKKCKR